METILGDTERAEAIYELAINQSKLDMPEVLWKAYIDFQIEQEEYDKTRKLYRRLLERTQHVKVGRIRFFLIFSHIFSVIVALINYCSAEVLRSSKTRTLVEDIVPCLMFDAVECFIS